MCVRVCVCVLVSITTLLQKKSLKCLFGEIGIFMSLENIFKPGNTISNWNAFTPLNAAKTLLLPSSLAAAAEAASGAEAASSSLSG